MPTLQEWIHSLEEGAGARVVRWVVFVLGLVALATVYNVRAFRNFEHPAAMDSSQIARNLSLGEGFTTKFVRPADLHFLKARNPEFKLGDAQPDLANAPVYPFVLSLWMRIGGFDFTADPDAPSLKHPAELRIACFNQFLFMLAIGLTWALARRLFDDYVAWVTAILLAGTDLLWQFTQSGLSTSLIFVLIVALAHVIVSLNRFFEEKPDALPRLLAYAVLAGVTVGLLGLSRYALCGLILPLVVYLSAAFQNRGMALGLAALLGFGVILTPWLTRNHQLSGMAFGTAGLSVMENTDRFPADKVYRLINPETLDSPHDIGKVGLDEYWMKLDANLPDIVQNDLPTLGGNWIVALFAVGLLVPFRNRSIARLRWFTLGSMGMLLLAQALVRSHFSKLVPDVNEANYLILLSPLVFMFGSAMLSSLIGRLEFTGPFALRLATVGIAAVLSLPLISKVVNGVGSPLAYPPYVPTVIQERGNWLGEEELAMSDAPWAFAWYGDRRCSWLPSPFAEGFVEIHSQKPINAVYLTSLSLDGRLVTDMMAGQNPMLGRFAAEAVVKEEVPSGFPLRHALAEGFPYQLFLSDAPRWLESTNQIRKNP
jgi:hypothetical protein